jgi:ankyrin repeat protein
MSPLMCAARDNPNPEVVSVLLRAGADGLSRSAEGKTALEYAAWNSNLAGTPQYRELERASLQTP